MAGVSTSVQLIDQMTAPILKITNSLNLMISNFEDVQRSGSSALDGIDFSSMRAPLDDAIISTIRLKEEVEKTPKGQAEFNKKVREGASSMDGLTRKVMGMVGAYASIQGLTKVINLSDQMAGTTARLNMIVDDGGTVSQLEQKIRASANRSRADYLQTADVVAKMQSQAGQAFSGNDEVIAFTELLNKQFVIAGNNAQQIDSVMYNLTQAMGSGVLRGQDLNAVMSNTPQIAKAIADYLETDIGKIREMAAEGQISADVVKNAMLASADDINAAFESMPMTFGQVAVLIKNKILESFAPVLEIIAQGAQWIYDNWSVLEPIFVGLAAAVTIYTIALGIHTAVTWAATGAATAFFAALLANPLTRIALAVGAVVAGLYAWAQSVGGVQIAWAIAMDYIKTKFDSFRISLIVIQNAVNNWADQMVQSFYSVGVGVKNHVGDMKVGVLMILQDMINGAISYINDFLSAINSLGITTFELIGEVTFGTTAAAENELQKEARNQVLNDRQMWVDDRVLERSNELNSQRAQYTQDSTNRKREIDALKRQAAVGDTESGTDMHGGFNQDISNNIGDTASNTKKIADSVELSEESLKYMRDTAEQEVINRFTTAEINLNMGGISNNVSSNMDLDGVVNYLTSELVEAVESTAGGMHY